MSSIFGFTVESELSFAFLRHGPSGAPLCVTEESSLPEPVAPPLLQWMARPDHPRGARLYPAGLRYAVWIDQSGWFNVDHRQPSIAVSPSADSLRREASLWGLPVALCFMERGDLALHAAAIDVGGMAILLAGPGHSGKTTLACGFLQAGYRILAEDLSCCWPGEPPLLQPGPAMLRVRRDTYEHLELAKNSVVAEEPDRLTLGLEDFMRGDGRPLPIRAIFLLGASAPSLAIEGVALPAAVRDVWALSFMLPRDADRARSFQAVIAITSAVPVWSLRWPKTFHQMPQVVNAIISTCCP